MNKFSVAVAGLALASAQPITYSGYVDPHQEGWNWEKGNGHGTLLSRCYLRGVYGENGGPYGYGSALLCGMSEVLASKHGRPSIRDYLAMFSNKFVESNGNFYAVHNSQGNGAMTYWKEMMHGLYEVIIPEGWEASICDDRCVVFRLLYKDDNIGQIIAAPARFDPIQVIGVDQVTNRIYGYYPTASGGWDRKRTVWGNAKDGSMRSSDKAVIGLSTNDRMFGLWGDFNYARHDDIQCSAPPSAIVEWTGRLAPYRGYYCPAADDNQLWKKTWHSSGTKKEKLNWAPASEITCFESGIWGISTDGRLLKLWNDDGTIRSITLDLPNIHGVRAVGGLKDKYVWGSGVLVTNEDDKVYNVYWRDGSWKEKEITIDKRFEGDGQMSVLFGSHNGEIYMLYGWHSTRNSSCRYCSLHEVYLYHMKFVGGEMRYEAKRIGEDTDV
mmetsp:Transcript_16812/g.26246  ORF Transcript_16812/g.26246 Transcript_16812/m.26246 type:complete len:440 (-) Transcript_16812:115-1434(-)|eukprot:CAMPEP_0201738940 /NCGR_PEP_ID=MMETSP0593-20130828/45512_1 /ASSEMBLY_ACC=CAM_ASM_000672 /TAXON_ID=267983 /ORGANISM="Skeletonema japonicum, Strain CCMP2506" /LENGTH=439 /DNA_ID=CAMNT_0048233171 /DNA_START=171 /DNA_END=1490 /DNA_ORIENTATION=-